MALNEYEGTVMLVSHDRALLRAVCDEFWMVSRGKVYPFEGDLEDYQQFLLDEAKRQKDEAKRLTNQPNKDSNLNLEPVVRSSNTKKPFLTPEQKKIKKSLEQLETKISSAQSEIAVLENHMTQASDANEIRDLSAKLALIQSSLQQDEEQWITLSEQIDTMII